MTKQQPAGNLSNGLENILKGFGVKTIDKSDALKDFIESEISERNIKAEVEGVRYNKLTLLSDAATAQFLRYDLDTLLNKIEKKFPGEITKIVIKVKK